MRLDDAEIALELQSAELAYRAAEEALADARFRNEKGLTPSDEVAKLKAAWQLAEIELKRCRLRLERTVITSPADGFVVAPDTPAPRAFAAEPGADGVVGATVEVSTLSPDPAQKVLLVGKKVAAGEAVLAVLAPPASQPAPGGP